MALLIGLLVIMVATVLTIVGVEGDIRGKGTAEEGEQIDWDNFFQK